LKLERRGGRWGGDQYPAGARCGQISAGLNRFSNTNKVKTGSHPVDACCRLCPGGSAPARPSSSIRFATGYIQTGKNPVLSQVGCGSREPQINLKKKKTQKTFSLFVFRPMTKEFFWIFFLCKSVI